jgi:predicted oxidoreductase (fatty acid repression mutant protein)
MSYLEAMKTRHSQYNLGKNIDGTSAVATLKEAVRLAPSAFNAEPGRVLILTGAAQNKFWGELLPLDLKAEMTRQGAPESAWLATAEKLSGFEAAYGTALFFEDQEVVRNLQETYPLYAAAFPSFSEQDSGIIAVAAWTALSEAGVGANLQHYNPVVDESVKKEWQVPESWVLKSQLVFGSIEENTGAEKEKVADSIRFMEAN